MNKELATYDGYAKHILYFYSAFFKDWVWPYASYFVRPIAWAYFAYKKYLEDPFDGFVRKNPAIFAKGNVLDIGAGIGYTACLFAKHSSPKSHVYAFEMHPKNYDLLQRVVKIYGHDKKIIPICAAVGSESKSIQIWQNEAHPSDHRVYTDSLKQVEIAQEHLLSTSQISIDTFTKENSIQNISFIKIDVQGYEVSVCDGMVETLNLNPQAVIGIEYGPTYLKTLGFEPSRLLEIFSSRNYRIYLMNHRGDLKELSEECLNREIRHRGYADLICSMQPLVQ